MSIIVTSKEIQSLDCLVGKTAAEQILLAPFVAKGDPTDALNATLRTNYSSTDLVIDYQQHLFVRGGEDETLPLSTLRGEDLKIEVPEEMLLDPIIDLSLIGKDKLYLEGPVMLDSSESLKNSLVEPLTCKTDLMFFTSRGKSGGFYLTDIPHFFNVIIDEQVDVFDKLMLKVKQFLPEGYQLSENEYLVARSKEYCFLIDSCLDKVIFVGKYKDDFLELSNLLVGDAEIQFLMNSLDIEDDSGIEPISNTETLEALTELMQRAKQVDVTLEDVIRLAVKVYE